MQVTEKIRRVLQRETSSGSYIAEIDGLRTVAVVAVLWSHVSGWVGLKYSSMGLSSTTLGRAFSHLLDQGFVGVQLFFAISGFVLALPFASHYLRGTRKPSYSSYLTRRLTRLEPPYIANLLIWTFVLVAVGFVGADNLRPIRDWSFLSHLFASLTYTHNVIFGHSSEINHVAWSLEVEAQFYLVAPFLAAAVYSIKRAVVRRGVVVGCIGLLSLYCHYHPAPGKPLHGLNLLYHLHYFLVGFILVDLYVEMWLHSGARRWLWDLGGLGCWVGIALVMTSGFGIEILLPWLIAGAYIAAFRGTTWNRVFRYWPVAVVGGMCYTIYLFHYLLLSGIGKVTKTVVVAGSYDATLLAYLVAMTLVIIPLCAVIFVILEKPFMRRDWPARMATWFRGGWAKEVRVGTVTDAVNPE